jgi:hypothetical protein
VSYLALTNEEREKLLLALAEGIDHSGMNLNEFIFATADMLKAQFWTSVSSQLNDEETEEVRERLTAAIQGVVQVLDDTTQSVAEDVIVLASVLLEAVNHIFRQVRQEQDTETPVE